MAWMHTSSKFDYVTRHQAMKRRGNFPYSSCAYNVPLSYTTSLLWCCYHDLLSGPEGYQGGTLASPTSRCINKHGWKWLQYLQDDQCLVVQCILQRKCYLGVEPANITQCFASCVINALEMVWEKRNNKKNVLRWILNRRLPKIQNCIVKKLF